MNEGKNPKQYFIAIRSMFRSKNAKNLWHCIPIRSAPSISNMTPSRILISLAIDFHKMINFFFSYKYFLHPLIRVICFCIFSSSFEEFNFQVNANCVDQLSIKSVDIYRWVHLQSCRKQMFGILNDADKLETHTMCRKWSSSSEMSFMSAFMNGVTVTLALALALVLCD